MDATSREQLFLQIIQENKARLYRLCRAYLPDKEEVDDLWQEVLINIWNSLPNFRSEAKPSTWAYRVAINTALTYRKQWLRKIRLFEKPKKEIQITDNQLITEEKIETEQKLNQLYTFIAKLKKQEKLIITLALEDLSYKEMAEIVGIEANYIGVKLNRIKAKLMEMMKEVSYE